MADYSELMKLEKKPVAPKVPVSKQIPSQEPVELPTSKDFVNKSTSQQVNKSVNQQINTSTTQQTNKSTNQQVNKSTNQQTSKTLKRFGSYLTLESLKELKRIAFEADKKDYEVLQEAVDEYLKRVKS